MSFTISNKEKQKVGILIHIYRTQKNISQEDFLMNVFQEKICSRQTLSKIEQGTPIKNDGIYEELLSKINLKFNTDISIENFFPKDLFQEVLKSCDYYDQNTLIDLSSTYVEKLLPLKDYVFFHEYYLCFRWIHSYYAHFSLPTPKEANFIIYLKDSIHPYLYEVMIDLVFKTKVVHADYDFSYFDFKNSNSMINRGNHMMVLYIQSKLTEMLEYCSVLEKEYIEKDNIVRLLDIYSLKGNGFLETETNKFYELEHQIKSIVKKNRNRIPETKISQLHKNLGIQAFRLSLYETAAHYYELYIEEKAPYTYIIEVELCISYEYLKQFDKIRAYLSNKDIYTGENQFQKLLNYFILKYKYNYTPLQLSSFIVESVPAIIDETMGKFQQFFYDQLSNLIDITKHYKDLKDYLDATSNTLPI